MDIILVFLVAPFALPIALLAWLISYVQGGRGLHRHACIGKDGKKFARFKIQTGIGGEYQKPLIRSGRFLRASSIDELPQLWNVLIGDMSLIGPKPLAPIHQAEYDLAAPNAVYYKMRPGVTGFWQVDKRNIASIPERAKYDEIYFRSLSLACDLKIAFRTVFVVFQMAGK
ncbi:MAG: sugar transferase [Paracoccaceae bacterium]